MPVEASYEAVDYNDGLDFANPSAMELGTVKLKSGASAKQRLLKLALTLTHKGQLQLVFTWSSDLKVESNQSFSS